MKTKSEYKNNLCAASNINITYQRICLFRQTNNLACPAVTSELEGTNRLNSFFGNENTHIHWTKGQFFSLIFRGQSEQFFSSYLGAM